MIYYCCLCDCIPIITQFKCCVQQASCASRVHIQYTCSSYEKVYFYAPYPCYSLVHLTIRFTKKCSIASLLSMAFSTRREMAPPTRREMAPPMRRGARPEQLLNWTLGHSLAVCDTDRCRSVFWTPPASPPAPNECDNNNVK